MNNVSGIYKIICLDNNKFYIGSSVDINRRLKTHINLLHKNKHKNKYLQNSWNKYGEKNFRYEIVETIYDISRLYLREKWWIDHTNCCSNKIGFNISSDPYTVIGVRKFIDLTGQVFGRLAVLEHEGKNKRGQHKWICKCTCGNNKTIIGDDLRSGHAKSCGCLIKEGNNLKHGHKNTPTYNSWRGMKSRCNNPNDLAYKNYGERNPPITVCERWSNTKNGFQNFLTDMGKSPGKEYSLVRIDKNQGYYKKNCKWRTRKEQSRNRKNNDLIVFNNKTQCLKDWAKELKIKYQTLWARTYIYKWSIKRAFTTPIR